jgi:dipeptidyl aminopeptidase/acylaminoacyl peptidase
MCVTLGLLCLSFVGCSKPKHHEVRQYTIEQFMNTTAISGSSISHDDKLILFSSRKTGIYNAYTVPVQGGEPTALTNSTTNSIFATSFFPNDNRILYRSDQGGNEINHIYLRNEDGGVEDLTPDPAARSEFIKWSHDRKSFFYISNKRNPKFFDLYEMDITAFTPNLLFKNEGSYDISTIDNSKRYLALVKTITEHNNEMYLYDRQTNEAKHLTLHEGDVNYLPQEFSVDGQNLYYLTDDGSEFMYLKKYAVASGQPEKVEEAKWDIMYATFSRTGRYRVLGVNSDARTEIRILDAKTNELVQLPSMPDADITSVDISDSEKLMTFYVNGSRSPNNLYAYNFETKQMRKLTETLNPEISQANLVDAKVVWYKSFDGLDIPALLYKPHQVQIDDKAPALVSVHGGPGGQSRIGYNALKQFLVNHGYVIIDVNNRGSSGYGKTFFKADDLKHGNEDLADCVEAKKFLATLGYVDTSRVGIMGGSYGGYMVLAALAFRPTEFAVGVDIFGVSNWLRTLKSIPPYWESFRKALYAELGDPTTPEGEAFLRAKSPLFHADKVQRPLIVLQGANDPRVLKAESDEIVGAAKKNGVPVEYVVFSDEGHGFAKNENQIKGNKAILDFLDKHLRGIKPM